VIVVDASVTAAWFLAEEIHADAGRVLEGLGASDQMLVPALWLWEMTSLVLSAQRGKRISKEVAQSVLEEIKGLPLRVASPPAVFSLPELHEIARTRGLSAYDAEYLRLARERDAPLASLDRALIRAARAEGVTVL
jgi:predicted nucleic acid-binding protein